MAVGGAQADLESIFSGWAKGWKSLDYVAGWFMRAADYGMRTRSTAAFVATNSICQGQQVPILWPLVFHTGNHIVFAHTSLNWANLAAHNAGVTVVIIGISNTPGKARHLFSIDSNGETVVRQVEEINAYLVSAKNLLIEPTSRASGAQLAQMQFGNHPYYGTALIFSASEGTEMVQQAPETARFIRPLYGSKEFINGAPRSCFWIAPKDAEAAAAIAPIASRLALVASARRSVTQDEAAQKLAETPFRFRDQLSALNYTVIVPRVSSENRPYIPVGLLGKEAVIQDRAFALYDAPLWNMAVIASRLHLVWIATVCVRLRTDFSYSNTLGWNTFPVPTLTETNKADLTRCAEDILLAREAHFPATIAELYDPDNMPADLREAHDRNDEVLERIYIGRRFRNDTERLEKLFELYTAMAAEKGVGDRGKGVGKKGKNHAQQPPQPSWPGLTRPSMS